MTDQTEQMQDFTRWLSTLRTELAESVNGIRLRAARRVAVGGSNPAKATTAPGVFAGFGLCNESLTDRAVVTFRDGDADNDVFLTVALAPGETAREWPSAGGVNLSRGLYVETVTGVVSGCVFLRVDE